MDNFYNIKTFEEFKIKYKEDRVDESLSDILNKGKEVFGKTVSKIKETTNKWIEKLKPMWDELVSKYKNTTEARKEMCKALQKDGTFKKNGIYYMDYSI